MTTEGRRDARQDRPVGRRRRRTSGVLAIVCAGAALVTVFGSGSASAATRASCPAYTTQQVQAATKGRAITPIYAVPTCIKNQHLVLGFINPSGIAGGSIAIASAHADSAVEVSVTDTGPGVAPADRARIFEEFQQTAVGLEQRDGTGLGLALSKRLVELHGGRIWVESEQDHGSRFAFTLPLGVA